MAEPKFKKGDKARPSKKGTSNYYQLKDLIEVEIINPDLHPSYTKKIVKVKILKGIAVGTHHHTWCNYMGDELELFQCDLELLIPEGQDYDIY